MTSRATFEQKIKQAFKVNPIVAILGPRQCGKTTLAKDYIAHNNTYLRQNYFDLERLVDTERLKTPELTLSNLTGLVVIDEVQRAPELFTTLRVLVDENRVGKNKRTFLILGSASTELIKQSAESLAGRISYIELTPFNLAETGNSIDQLWLRGGFPRSYLAADDEASFAWRLEYVRTFLEQDIPNLGITIPPANLHRFWMMLAHYHGNIFNASEIGRSLGLSHKTIRNYLDILAGTFMVRELAPWFANISKRQVKSPKIYFRDSGILHTLLNVQSRQDLLINPKLGASWEGLALEEIIRHLQARDNECFFWATHGHAELDLLIIKGNKKFGFEFKYTDTPKMTPSMKIALEHLELDRLFLIYPGDVKVTLASRVEAIGLLEFLAAGLLK